MQLSKRRDLQVYIIDWIITNIPPIIENLQPETKRDGMLDLFFLAQCALSSAILHYICVLIP